MKTILKYFIIIALLSLGGFLFYKRIYIPKTTYESISPTLGDLSVRVFGIGNVGAKSTYLITAQTGGRVLSILTDEGRWVKRGDLLITMDSVDVPYLLEEAKLSVSKAEMESLASEKELDGLLAQKRLLSITFQRYSRLLEKEFVSHAEYDKVKADYDAIKAQIEATKAHMRSAKAEISRAKKGVDSLKTKLNRYKVYAPVDGYVISREVEVGQSVLPSQSILKIVDPKTVWVKAYIDEKLSGEIKIGKKATIRLRSQPHSILQGYVQRIVAQSDAVTQEREVDVAFEKLPIPFYINEQAEVTIDTAFYEDVLKIPAHAMRYYQGEGGVWLNQHQKAHFQPLEIIARGEEEIAVKGITPNSKIILPSPKNKELKEGMSIH